MEQTQRIVLYVALLVVSFMLWNAWQKDYPLQAHSSGHPAAVSPSQSTTATSSTTNGTNFPKSETMAPTKHNTTSDMNAIPASRLIHVKTDVLNISIDKVGGNIVDVSLLKYSTSLETPNEKVDLLSRQPEKLYIAESALIGKNSPDSYNGLGTYQSVKTNYQMSPDAKQLIVDLTWNKKGVIVTKRFTFTKGKYLVNVAYDINNNSSQPVDAKLFTQITRKEVSQGGGHYFQIHPYFGAAISSPKKRYQEVTFSEMNKKPVNENIKNGWAAMVQRYFVSAWIPSPDKTFNYYSKVSNNGIYTIGMSSPSILVQPGSAKTVSAQFYAGPEIAKNLKPIAPGLELTISYGWLWFISVIIFWVMDKIFWIVGNWGWAIILVTCLIKLIFYPLSEKSYRSMAKMRKLQPKMEAIRERYADDKQKQSSATMELYKKEKVNPLGGCLPILVQIPVFFALYMVLIESVQLRQAPWILWIHDLSIPDPWFVLPVLMGASMFIQQKLNPPPPDPTQAKIMMYGLPVMFTVLFAWFPAGLVLYWFVNNTLSILQQWHVMRKLDRQPVKAIKKSKK